MGSMCPMIGLSKIFNTCNPFYKLGESVMNRESQFYLQMAPMFQQFTQEGKRRASLVVQWFRIHLPMQGTQVQFLVQEDSTGHRTTKPVHHSY